MPIDLPAEVSRQLSEFEATGTPLNAIELAAQIDAAVGPLEMLTQDQCQACLTEIPSLRFMATSGGDREL